MERTLARELNDNVGKTVLISGWVHAKRSHGTICFIDIRDRTGLTQAVILPGNQSYDIADGISIESVVSIVGIVKERPPGMINEEIISGHIELQVEEFTIISRSKMLPFEIGDTSDVNEELRLKYRYLDIRSKRMRHNILMRHTCNQFIRNWFTKNEFIEVETPLLTKSTPEGARDFLVPSRNQPGTFYALPQSPQQYKQLLQVGGIERYFQLVRNMRDEDQRGDRQAEFSQIDIEASFISQEDILRLSENFLITLVENVFPEKHFTLKPFPRLTYDEAIKRYSTDKPDLRKDKNDPHELAAVWIIDFPMFEKMKDGSINATHHPFTSIKESCISDFEHSPIESVHAQQYDLSLNGTEVAGGSIRTHDSSILSRVFEYLGHSKKDIREKFGHLLDAFEFGVPPHGGIAWGYDRLLMILLGEPSIREVIPFPKTGDGRDPLMDSPSPVDPKQLHELHISITKK